LASRGDETARLSARAVFASGVYDHHMGEPADSIAARRAVDDRVKDLYMRYPYPPADIDSAVPLFGLLDYVRHVLWPARPNLDSLRILDAGCGTGQLAVYIARTFPTVRVLGIDISTAS
jgi:SAM-dependent methyltransferase